MKLPEVTVVSTGFRAANAEVCKGSVRAQRDVDVMHIYIEACEQDPPKTKMQNLVEALAPLPDDRVVCLVDGDDWLAHRRALSRIAQAHARGMWVTFGSFATTDGDHGFAAPYLPGENYRVTPWRATHLKTFRAGLFNRIDSRDLRMPVDAQGRCVLQGPAVGNAWIDRADDPAFMFPMLEMAGRDRTAFIPDILYIYAASTAWETTATPADLDHERAIMALTRGRRQYARLGNLGDPSTYQPVPTPAGALAK